MSGSVVVIIPFIAGLHRRRVAGLTAGIVFLAAFIPDAQR